MNDIAGAMGYYSGPVTIALLLVGGVVLYRRSGRGALVIFCLALAVALVCFFVASALAGMGGGLDPLDTAALRARMQWLNIVGAVQGAALLASGASFLIYALNAARCAS